MSPRPLGRLGPWIAYVLASMVFALDKALGVAPHAWKNHFVF